MVEETSLVYLSPSPLSPSPHEEGLPLAGMSAPTALQRVISANSAMNSASRLWEEEENDVPTDLDSILEESSTLVAHGGEGEGEGRGRIRRAKFRSLPRRSIRRRTFWVEVERRLLKGRWPRTGR